MHKAPVYTTSLTASSEAVASANKSKGAVLYVSEDCQEYAWKKVAIVASLVGEPVESVKLSATDFATLAPHARSVCLAPRGGGPVVAGPNAAARCLAVLREDLGVGGSTEWEEAKVDQWVEFCWHELEVALGAVSLPAAPGEPPFDARAVAAMASKDVAEALRVLNSELSGATFLAASGGPTLADAAAVAVLAEVWTRKPELVQGMPLAKAYPHLSRWFLTCAHHASFAAVLGAEPVAALRKLLAGKGAAPAKVGLSGAAAAAAAKPLEAAAAAKEGKGKGGGGGGGSGSGSSGGSSGGASAAPPAAKKALGCPASGNVPALVPRFNRGRTVIKDVLVGAAGAEVGSTVVVKGWARTVRAANKGALLFVVLNDGSCAGDIQCVVDKGVEGFDEAQPAKSGGTGAAYAVTGVVAASMGKGQALEIKATKVELVGAVFAGEDSGADGKPSVGGYSYPLSKKGHSFEYMREKAHLRPRTKAYACTQRLRNAMAFATHTFFHDRGFQYVHTPLITASDCEGAGEMFHVTTLLPKDPKGDLPRTKSGEVDYSQDFFGKQAGMTVSGQLNVETHACALSDVYTFGPTFRAENSHTSRHLAEFWMIEPEIAFAGLAEDMDLAEDYLKHCVHWALTNCMEDLATLETVEGWDSGLRDRLKNIIARPFQRMTYTQAIEVLQKEVAAKKVSFEENDIVWGMDMGSEHERYLAEVLYKGPVIVTNYPKGIKAFYMKLDPSGETVQGMDILVPRIGEIIGGSVREDDFSKLKTRAAEVGITEEALSWYLDLRKYGSVPHAGFGLGFERLVMLVTGVENIRDTIPFPRYPGHCAF